MVFDGPRRDRIGRIPPRGVVTHFSAGIGIGHLYRITTGAEGNLWYLLTDPGNGHGSRVGRNTPRGFVSEFPIAWLGEDIAAGPDGNVWFIDPSGSIDRVTPEGRVTEFDAGGDPPGISVGADGKLWFTEYSAPGREEAGASHDDHIVRIRLPNRS